MKDFTSFKTLLSLFALLMFSTAINAQISEPNTPNIYKIKILKEEQNSLDVKICLNQVNNTTKILVEQWDDGAYAPYTYYVTNIDFNSGKAYFTTQIDAEYITDFTISYINDIKKTTKKFRVVRNQLISSMNNEKLLNLKVYPNPTTDILFIEGADNIEKIRIFDTQGRLVHRVTKPSDSQIDVSNLPNGIYNLHIDCEGISKEENFKFIKN